MNAGLLRIALLGSRGTWGRLAGIAAGIAVGTLALVLLVGAFVGLQDREPRTLWAQPIEDVRDAAEPLTADTAVVASEQDRWGERFITRLEIAVTEETAFAVPGAPTVPAPGEFYASPALAELVGSIPAHELGDRFGTLVGVLPDDVLVGPDALVAVVGLDEEVVRSRAVAIVTDDLVGESNGESVSYQAIIAVGAVGIFFPVVLFVAIVTQLGAAQRAERFSALRLIGASPKVVTRLAAVETVVTAVVGSVAGILLAWVLRPVAARVSLNGNTFFPDDLALPWWATAAVVPLMVVVTTAAAVVRLRRSGVGPLGASRTIQERQPSARRLLPLTLGLAMLVSLVLVARYGVGDSGLYVGLMVAGFALVSWGVVMVGPWLTSLVGRWGARRAATAAGLIASGRVVRHPAATFRSVSGLVVAVFMVTVFSGAASTVVAVDSVEDASGLLPSDALMALVTPGQDDGLRERLLAVPGVDGVGIGAMSPEARDAVLVTAADATVFGFSTQDVSEAVGTGSDAGTSASLAFSGRDYWSVEVDERAALGAADAVLQESALPTMLVVCTDGSPQAVEAARTAVWGEAALAGPPLTRAEIAGSGPRQLLNELAFVAYLGALLAIVVAGCSLAVATAAAMLERRRVLGLLRLVGMPGRDLRRIITFESAVPLVAVLGLSVGLGFAVAWMIVTALPGGMSMHAPQASYYLTIGAGLAMALAAVAATFRTVGNGTAISSTRFE